MVDPNIVETYTVGKKGFIVALCESLGVTELFNQSLSATNGRPTDIPYGVDAMLMMVNMFKIPSNTSEYLYQGKRLTL